MRSWYREEQAALHTPAEQLRSRLSEDQFVFMWDYSLILLSNHRHCYASHGVMKVLDFENALGLCVKARKFYIQGQLRKAADLVASILNGLTP